MTIIHSIPVGGNEPIHLADKRCWCYPTQDLESFNLFIHNAKDCREFKERRGINTPNDSFWIIVGSFSQN
jgi:hypothetical protein